MLLTDKQTEQWIEWFTETYEEHCTRDADWRLSIPVIYSDNPEETEKEHMKLREEELRKLMKKDYDRWYTHRWGRKDTLWNAQLQALWLYNSPYFKNIKDKENETNPNTTSQQEVLWDLW